MVLSGNNQDSRSNSYQTSCTLLVPGLLTFPELIDEHVKKSLPQFKGLELFLARAKSEKTDSLDFEAAIFDYFDVKVSPEQCLPVAAVSYLGDTGNTPRQWIVRADPVHLMPDRDKLMLLGPENLSLTRTEADHLVAVLNDFFSEDDWRIEVATAERWYLHVPTNPDMHTYELSKVLDKVIGEFLPHGPEGGRWRRAMNEVQMVLHRNDVNVQRQSENKLPVNSLWFWGEGELPCFGHSRWGQLWSSEPVSLGLARLTRTPREELPASSHDWLSKINTPGEHLIVDSRLQYQTYDNPADWNKALTDFQEHWLNPLLKALSNRMIDQLTLDSCNGKTYRLSSGGLKRWWRRKKPVYAYCR